MCAVIFKDKIVCSEENWYFSGMPYNPRNIRPHSFRIRQLSGNIGGLALYLKASLTVWDMRKSNIS